MSDPPHNVRRQLEQAWADIKRLTAERDAALQRVEQLLDRLERTDAGLLSVTTERDALRAALRPFADLSKGTVVKAAFLSGQKPPLVYLSRGGVHQRVDATLFFAAAAALADAPEPK